MTITSGSSGSGSGTVNYTVAANTAATRQGTLTIAGWTFTVTQSVPTDLYFQNQAFTSGLSLYQALNSIIAENGVTITTGASVTFASANFIRLGPGFQATAGTAATTFRAVIDPTIH